MDTLKALFGAILYVAVIAWSYYLDPLFGVFILCLASMHLIFVFLGSKKRLLKACSRLQKTLMDGEEMIEWCCEKRLYALFKRRSLAAITNSRIITITRPILGGFKMVDVQWKDLTEAKIEQNVLPVIGGSLLTFCGSTGELIASINTSCDAAAKIYRTAQKQEQAWEEKNRIREMEEIRAASGGTYINSQSSENARLQGSIFDEILKAKDLLDENIISDAEFEELKAKIINGAI